MFGFGKPEMRAWLARFNGAWLGGHAIIVALNEDQARASLERRLRDQGLWEKVSEDGGPGLSEIDLNHPQVVIVDNGDY